MSSVSSQQGYPRFDASEAEGYTVLGCCCHVHPQPETCSTKARNYKTYLALIFIPYLILIVIFHTQLQVYDTVSKVVEEEGTFRGSEDQQEQGEGKQSKDFYLTSSLTVTEEVLQIS